MKKIIFLVFLLTSSQLIKAQYSREVGWVSKFGLAGGVTPMWVVPNLDQINNSLPGFGLDQLSTNGLFGLGGAGYAYIMFIDNVRIGGMGFNASANSEKTVNGFGREAEYSIGGGAVTIEYTIPSIKRIAVSFGVMIGGGSIELDLYQNNGEFTWQEIWTELPDPKVTNQNISRRITNSYYSFTPTINTDIPITRFIAVRIGAGYQFTFGDDWEIENGQNISGVPDDLNGNAFFVQTGLFLGFFAF